MVRPKQLEPRGILHPRSEIPGYGRFWPDAKLSRFVEHFWTVEWDVDEPLTREVLPHPSIHLGVERDRSRVVGIPKGRFLRRLEGAGRILGVKFHPGLFRPVLGRAVSELSDRVLPLAAVLDIPVAELEEQALARRTPSEAFVVLQSFLETELPRADERSLLARRIVEHASVHRRVTRVDQLASTFDLSVRSLQRLFDEHVGVGPKWVIQRYRLHEAAERIASGEVTDWARLALDLGYADQAHFIRDFRRWVGASPADYARTYSSKTPGR